MTAALQRDVDGWARPGQAARLVGRADDGRWWWAPESWAWGDVVHRAPRFGSEQEALDAARAWLAAGEPEVTP